MSTFHFKQFSIDQTDAAMKVNTDGVLLGSLIEYNALNPSLTSGKETINILDIGTGTGVVGLMLAQRFPAARIDAVEINELSAIQAAANFSNSPFANRITLIGSSFQEHLAHTPRVYDLVVSNPPFFLNALRSGDAGKNTARHTDEGFFLDLLQGVSARLSVGGTLTLILPAETAELVSSLAWKHQHFFTTGRIFIRSFPDSEPFRQILVLSPTESDIVTSSLSIYSGQGVYSEEYRVLLKDFLTIF